MVQRVSLPICSLPDILVPKSGSRVSLSKIGAPEATVSNLCITATTVQFNYYAGKWNHKQQESLELSVKNIAILQLSVLHIRTAAWQITIRPSIFKNKAKFNQESITGTIQNLAIRVGGTELLEVLEGDWERPRAGIEHGTPQGFDLVFSTATVKGKMTERKLGYWYSVENRGF